jgi:cell surface protein SprA
LPLWLNKEYCFDNWDRSPPHHDYEIENLIDKQNRTTVDYAYTFKPKTVEPFKNTKLFKKSGYYKMLSDFNFNYLPSNVNSFLKFIVYFVKHRKRKYD